MMRFAAFADEIGPDLDDQIRVCKENKVTHFELRGVAGKNVLDFDQALRKEIKTKLAANGMGVASIGSPIGKVEIDQPWEAHFDRFKIAVELAEFFDSPYIRLFSYWAPKGKTLDGWRDEIMKRMQAKTDYVKNSKVILVHENEKHIYGDTGERCLDIMKTINSPKLRMAFDFANFVQCGEKPLDNWKLLKPYSVHIHIKDARLADGKVTPAGQGDGQLVPILKDLTASGYTGFLSLEPHLKHAGLLGGDSGPELFKVAADAIRKLCRENQVPLAGA